MRHASWEVVNRANGITLIRDENKPGYPSITNDAEYVYRNLSTFVYPRVVYQDTDKEWWEIMMVVGDRPSERRIAFKPWHGEVWDALSR